MKNKLPEVVERFNALVEECEVFLFIARDTSLQVEACEKLQAQGQVLAQAKAEAIEDNDEDLANLLLGCECVARALHNEIHMWVLLKQEEPEKAWERLVDAQSSAVAAARAHKGFEHLQVYNEKLEMIEKVVFPPQVFLSSGLIINKQECSICGQDYDECEHLVMKPYMGKFCHIVAKDIEADHVAIVDVPADKACRVITFNSEGQKINKMTWKAEELDESDTDGNMTCSAIIVRTNK